jgi:CDP-diacylglycerol--serine O-phosphatidyltransferase
VRDAVYVSGWLILVGVGAVTALPSFAGKRVKLPVGSVLPVLAVVGLLGAGVVTQPWITYLGLATIYIFSLPIAAIRFQQDRRAYEASGAVDDEDALGDELK